MEIKNLWVTQNRLRDYCQLPAMIDFVSSGGFWTQEVIDTFNKSKNNLLIHIAQFEDGRRYIHDGHHRCTATLLGGREELREDEYFVKQYTYERYMTPKYDIGYYIPFDPRYQVRSPDFFKFKEKCAWIHYYAPYMLERWLDIELDNWIEERYIRTVEDLATMTKDKI